MTPCCPTTSITIPECSCSACIEEMLSRFAPHLLEMDARQIAWRYV